MTDRVKVIMGLECLITNKVDCDGCPYNESENSSCLKNIAKDALELLKKQESVKPTYHGDDSYLCGNCGETVGWEELDVFGIDPVKYKFCPGCGRKVKWG